jgi:hypothetical protein
MRVPSRPAGPGRVLPNLGCEKKRSSFTLLLIRLRLWPSTQQPAVSRCRSLATRPVFLPVCMPKKQTFGTSSGYAGPCLGKSKGNQDAEFSLTRGQDRTAAGGTSAGRESLRVDVRQQLRNRHQMRKRALARGLRCPVQRTVLHKTGTSSVAKFEAPILAFPE